MSVKEEYICFIPDCRNSSVENPEKRFIRVPVLSKTRELWIQAGLRLRSKKPIVDNSPLFCCEDHFDLKKDTSNKWKEDSHGMGIKLKRGVLPHIFPKKPPPVQTQKEVQAEIEKKEDSKILQEALFKYEEKKKRKEIEKAEAHGKKRRVVQDILAWIPMDSTSKGGNNQTNANPILVVQPPVGSYSSASTSPLANSTCGPPPLFLLNQNSLISSPVVVQNGQNHLLLTPPVQKPQRLILPAESINRPNRGKIIEPINTVIPKQDTITIPIMKGSPTSPLVIPIHKNESSDDVTSPGITLIQNEYKKMRSTIASLNSEVAKLKKEIDDSKTKKILIKNESNKPINNSESQFEEKVIEIMKGVLSPAQVRMVLYSKKNDQKTKGKKKIVWSKDDIIRAINLRNNITPRGYRFLRTVLNYPVPAPSSIKRYIMLERKQLEDKKKSTKVEIENTKINETSKENKVVLVEQIKQGKPTKADSENFVSPEYLEINIVDNQMEVNSQDIIINNDSVNSKEKYLIEEQATSEGGVEEFLKKKDSPET